MSTNRRKVRGLVVATMTSLFEAAVAVAQQPIVYPANGQSPEQQKQDQSQCYAWAVQQSGYDPAKPPPQAATPPTTATGTAPGAGMRGARRRAFVGEIVADDAGVGAAVGAVAACLEGRG